MSLSELSFILDTFGVSFFFSLIKFISFHSLFNIRFIPLLVFTTLMNSIKNDIFVEPLDGCQVVAIKIGFSLLSLA